MIGKKTIDDKPVSLSDVKAILSTRKETGELTYEQKVSFDYVKKFSKVNQKKITEAMESLVSEGIDEKTAVKIINVMPSNPEQIKLIFEKARFDLKEPQIKKILEIVKGLEKD